MLDYARKMKLAASDTARRIALKVVAGMITLIGAGFLLAALWVWLADHLGWGSLTASLVIGAAFMIIGLLLLVGTGRARHRPPSTDELREEISERLGIATDVVLDRVTGRAERAFDKVKETAGDALDNAQNRASQLADLAGNRMQSFVDTVTFKADRAADSAEGKARELAQSAGELAEKAGLGAERRESIGESLASGAAKVKSSNLATLVPLIGAVAIGITAASRFQSWRRGDGDEFADDGTEDLSENWDEGWMEAYPPEDNHR